MGRRKRIQDVPQFRMTSGDRAFLNEADPSNYNLFAQYYFDVELFPWQQYFLGYPCKDKLAVAGIRTGKSFATAVGLLEFAYWNPGSRCLNVSITADQAMIIFNDLATLAQLPRFRHLVEKIVYHPYPQLKLYNGAEIWSRSIGGAGGDAATIRGWEFDYINIDEAAYLVNKIAVDTLRGRLIGVNKITNEPRYGLLTMTTTPKGAVSWLYDRWKLGDPQYPGANSAKYLSLRARTWDNTKLDPQAIADLMAEYSERQRMQELEGIFIAGDTIFNFEDLMAICGRLHQENILEMGHYDPYVQDLETAIIKQLNSRQPRTKFTDVPQTIEFFDLEPQPNHAYVASWDLGARAVVTGRMEGRNATVGMVYDITNRPWTMVAYRYDTRGHYSTSMGWVKEWHLKYNNRGRSICHTRIDAVGPGDVIHQMLEEEQYRIEGFKASMESKTRILQAAVVATEKRLYRTPFIRRFVDQHQTYERSDKFLAQDIVMTNAQALHLARALESSYTTSDTVIAVQHGSLAGLHSARRTQKRSTAWRRQ